MIVCYPESFAGERIVPLEGKSLRPIFERGKRSGHEEGIFWEHRRQARRKAGKAEAGIAAPRLNRSMMYIWKRKLEKRAYGNVRSGQVNVRDRQIQELQAKITVRRRDWPSSFGTGFFRECLAADQGDTPAERRRWREHIYAEIRSRARTQGELTIQRMCELAGVSRASFYRSWEQQEPTAAEMAVRDAIQRAALEHCYYGYRRIAAHLQRHGLR